MTDPAAPALAAMGVLFAAAAVAVRAGAALPEPANGSGHVISAPSLTERIGRVPALARLAGRDRLRSLAEAAGDRRTVEGVVGRKWLWAWAALLGAGWLLSPLLAPVVALAAFRAPDMRLARQARRRRLLADRELPLFLDLLAAGVSAGLTGQLAMRRATEATQGPLSEELATALRRVDLGGRWRTELPAAAERLDLPDLRRATAVLARSEALGSALAAAVGDIARDARDARRAAVAERARKAPVKMLFPLVFLVLPAFLLLTVVPVLVTTLQSIR